MIPARYAWLLAEKSPRMLVQALALYGRAEVPGDADNPEIIAWSQELGLRSTYTADSIPWCGLFIAIVAKRAGYAPVSKPLWALSWKTFGLPAEKESLGDVLVFKREGGGHVALYVGEDATCYHCLGGNQSDTVNITRIAKARCVAFRRPPFSVKPKNVRPIILAASGAVSTNEA